MSDHLDECPEVFIDCYGTLCDCEYSHFCICDALRACEQRVRGEEQQRIESALKSVGQHDVAWELAIRERTLRDARDAIIAAKSLNVASSRALDKEARFIWMNHALEAIDALRKDGND
jgi:hypothetical protein